MQKKIKDIFISTLGQPEEIEKLTQYIDFCYENNDLNEQKVYCERHHILPRALFPEYVSFKKFPWNETRLIYDNHVKAHMLLFECYPIKEFGAPLNRMDNDCEEHKKKFGQFVWEYMKLNPKKYNNWVNKKKEYMKRRWEDPEYRKIMCEQSAYFAQINKEAVRIKMLEYWTDEKKKEASIVKKQYYIENGTEHVSIALKKRYANSIFYQSHKEKMTLVNKDKTKRKNAGEKIKDLWKDPEFREKTITPRLGLIWWNNGDIEKKSFECPGIEWSKGRMKFSENTKRKMKASRLKRTTNETN